MVTEMNTKEISALKILAVVLAIAMLLQGCGNKEGRQQEGLPQEETSRTIQTNETVPGEEKNETTDGDEEKMPGGETQGTSGAEQKPEPIDLEKIKPNEAGRIMIVMFHNFVEEYTKGDKEFTTTFDAFEKLLYDLYDKGYRLINLNDYLEGNIDVPAGYIPMVFTFDDGTAGQFNLVEKDGKLVANPRSAVGIMEKFNETHPDFGLKGTFYVNLGTQTFGSEGTLQQRLEYLISKGFEIGNHTYTHINLAVTKTADKIQEEIGRNQKKMYELVPGYKMKTFSRPYGNISEELIQYVIKGQFEGVQYENFAIMKVGAEPAPSPFSVKFAPMATPRVRAPGIEPVDQDLDWWLDNMSRDRQYISDGNPDTVTVPKSQEEFVKIELLHGRELVVY